MRYLAQSVSSAALGRAGASGAGVTAAMVAALTAGSVFAPGAAQAQFSADACSGSGGTYLCTGSTTTTQFFANDNLSVTADSTFTSTTTSGDAFYMRTDDSDLTFTQSAGGLGITGYSNGIVGYNDASGALSITTTGTVTGSSGDGIRARHNYSGNGKTGTITITANGNVDGNDDGIDARSYKDGNITVTTNGTVSGGGDDGGDGIDVRLRNNYGNLNVARASEPTIQTVIGGEGSGSITITANSDVTGYRGIRAQSSQSGDVTVTTRGSVTGEYSDGIRVQHRLYGAYNDNDDIFLSAQPLTITTEPVALVNGPLPDGNVTITTYGSVTGRYEGVEALTERNGDITITTNGTVTANGSYGDGIRASHKYGEKMKNAGDGDGDLTITANASVTAVGEEPQRPYGFRSGIRATSSTGGNVTITTSTAATVTGGNYGIYATHRGYSDGDDYPALESDTVSNAEVASDGGNLTITTNGAVVGGISRADDNDEESSFGRNYDSGIVGYSSAAGDITITANGTVTGGGYGIAALHYSNNFNHSNGLKPVSGRGLEQSVQIQSPSYPVLEEGNLTITANADVVGTDGAGIWARSGRDGDITITTNGSVTGARDGIYARLYGGNYNSPLVSQVSAYPPVYSGPDGNITIVTNGTVTATGDGDESYGDGIDARNYQSGDISITTNGAVVAGSEGIRARNYNGGMTTIVANGPITSAYDEGVEVDNYRGTTGATVTTVGPVSAYDEGVEVDLRDGAMGDIIVTTGAVTSLDDDALEIDNQYSGGNIVITTNGALNAYSDGIDVDQRGSGDLTITASGPIVGGSRGIEAEVRFDDYYNYKYSYQLSPLSVTASDTPYDQEPMEPPRKQIVTVTATGDVTGERAGILVDSEKITDVTVTTSGAVSGREFGIVVINGYGKYSEPPRREVVRLADSPYDSTPYDYITRDGSVTITSSGPVTGEYNGIGVANYGGGAISITTSGAVTANAIRDDEYGGDSEYSRSDDRYGVLYSATGIGIAAVNKYGTSLTIESSAPVSGPEYGIAALNLFGSGPVSITISAPVTGDSGVAIYAAAIGRGALETLEVEEAPEFPVAPPGRLELQPGWATNGETIFGGIDEGTLEEEGGLVTTGLDNRLVFGGESTQNGGVTSFDLARWDDGTGTPDGTSGRFFGFAPILLKEDSSTFLLEDSNGPGASTSSIIFSEASITGGTLGLNRGTSPDMTLRLTEGGTLMIGPDGTLAVGDGTSTGMGLGRVLGNISNTGTVNLSSLDGGAGTRLEVTGDFTAGSGSLIVDADASTDTADVLAIGGNVNGGTTTVVVNDVTSGPVTENDILVVDVEGTASADKFALQGDTVELGGVLEYGLEQKNNDFFLVSQGFTSAALAYETLPIALVGMADIGPLEQRQRQRTWVTGGGSIGASQNSNVFATQGSPWVWGNSGIGIQNGVWFAFSGQNWDVNPASSTTGLSFDQNVVSFEAGVDLIIGEFDTGILRGGVSLYTGRSTIDAKDSRSSASTESQGTGVGLSATWFGDNGLYADGQLMFHRFDSDLTADGFGTVASDVDGDSLALSLEVGSRIDSNSGWTWIPQGQLIFSNSNFDTFTGPNGERVSSVDTDSTRLRLGVAAEKTWNLEQGNVASFYGIANAVHEFQPETSVLVDNVKLSTEIPEWAAQIGVGGTLQFNEASGLFGQVTFTESISDGDLSGVSGSFGFRLSF